MDDPADFLTTRTPTSEHPLLGRTVLAVEDSRFACEAVRLLCLRSGARIRRADSLRSAARHLQVYRPSVVIVDMGLPDGSGGELIAELAGALPRVDVLLATSGDESTETEAMDAGADSFILKPMASLSVFQNAILRHLPADQHPPGPRAICADMVAPDPIAYRDDMAHVADVLAGRKDERTLDYVAQFLRGVAKSAEDTPLGDAVDRLTSKRAKGEEITSALERLSGMVQERMVSQRAV